jgi:hypothetical protein
MKNLFSIAALIALSFLATGAAAQDAPKPADTTAKAAAPAPTAEKKARPPYYEKQPEMFAAIQSLKEALVQLKKAGGGKGGHRSKAMKKIQEAMKDIRRGVAYDNKNLTADEKKKMEADFKAEEKEIQSMATE